MPYVYGYARGSTSKQVMTMAAQEERVRAYYQSRLSTTHEWGGMFADSAESAVKTFFTARPAGKDLDRRAERGDSIIMAKIDRGFRSPRDCAVMCDIWVKRGIGLHLIDVGLDTTTSQGRLFLGILSYVAAFEADMISDRTREVWWYRKRNGMSTGHTASLGWQWIEIPGEHYKKYVPDFEERRLMRQIVKRHLGGESCPEIAEDLNLQGIRPRSGALWAQQSVHRYYQAGLTLLAQTEGRPAKSSSAAQDSDGECTSTPSPSGATTS